MAESLKIALHALISKQHSLRTEQYHTGYQESCENVLGLTSFQIITTTIFVLQITTANAW